MKLSDCIKAVCGLLLCFCSLNAWSYDFKSNGICYRILSATDLTVEVIRGDTEYKGMLAIPSTVSYKSKTLTVTSIADSVFYGCTELTSITLPGSVKKVGNYAFGGCNSLKEIRFEDGTENLQLGYEKYDNNSVGKGLFYDCPLETLYLGRNLLYNVWSYYGFSPFYNIKTLVSVTIGNDVTMIPKNMFYKCDELKSICFLGVNAPVLGNNNFTENQFANLTLYVNVNSMAAYKESKYWGVFWNIKKI